MKTFYVYSLIDPRTLSIFYIGKGTGNRAWQHEKFKDGNNNLYKDRTIKNIQESGQQPIVILNCCGLTNESEAYRIEERLIREIGISRLTNIVENAKPPSKKGWKPTKETLQKRSQKLKGIARSDSWRQKLSETKVGPKNPRFGVKDPCSEERALAIIRGKNLQNYDLYKRAIEMMNSGISADETSKKLGIGRGVCFRLKNRTHLFFKAFPELI